MYTTCGVDLRQVLGCRAAPLRVQSLVVQRTVALSQGLRGSLAQDRTAGPLRVRVGPLRVRVGPLRVRMGPLRVRVGPLALQRLEEAVNLAERRGFLVILQQGLGGLCRQGAQDV